MRALRRSLLLALPLVTVTLAACGSSPESAPSPGVAVAADAPEEVRVQAFLDARYRAGDVRHSFQTPAGDAIDCIDFDAQPGARDLVARGLPIARQPPPPRAAGSSPARPVDGPQPAAPHGLDEDGNARACPTGTVAQLRITPEHIRAVGGIDAFLAAVHAPKIAPPTPGHPSNCDFPNYAHVIGAPSVAGQQVTEGSSTMAIYAPNTPAGDHSIAQTWTYSGYNLCDGTTSTVQSVEVGWVVDPILNKDENPHLFIFATSDGYHSTGCWNGASGSGCLPWVQYSGTDTAGMSLPVSGGGTTHELALLTENYAGNWWIAVTIDGASQWLGYYPGSDYSGTMPSYADNFEAGGEVYDGTGQFLVPMGSGASPQLGYGQAAYHYGTYSTGLVNGQMTTEVDLTFVTARPGSYTDSTTPAKGGSNWGNYFYYGNTCHPATCAQVGATCGAASDGCGGTLSCGSCGAGTVCKSNECVCAPQVCRLPSKWNQADCACEVPCNSPRTCCIQAGGYWDGTHCE
jgi:hypothetical protein